MLSVQWCAKSLLGFSPEYADTTIQLDAHNTVTIAQRQP